MTLANVAIKVVRVAKWQNVIIILNIGYNQSALFQNLGSLLVRASHLRLNGREFDPRPPHHQVVGTGMGDSHGRHTTSVCNQPPRPTQPPTILSALEIRFIIKSYTYLRLKLTFSTQSPEKNCIRCDMIRYIYVRS